MGVEYPPAIDMFIDDPAWVWPGILAGIPGNRLSIVIHKTACNGFCSATDVANFFHNDAQGHKSVHFIVGKDGSVIQVVRLANGAGGNCCLEVGFDTYWSTQGVTLNNGVTSPNVNTISYSIEHEDWTVNNTDVMPIVQIDASFALVKFLCSKFGIPASNIKGHNSLDPISRAHCPGSTYPMSQLIQEVKSMVTTIPGVTTQQKAVWNYPIDSLNNLLAPVTPIPYIRTNTNIYKSWAAAYTTVNMGGATGNEVATTDWAGNPIMLQYFASGIRCEYSNLDNIARFYDSTNKRVY